MKLHYDRKLRMSGEYFVKVPKTTVLKIDCRNASANTPIRNPFNTLYEASHDGSREGDVLSVLLSSHLSVKMIITPIPRTTPIRIICQKNAWKRFEYVFREK